MEKNHNFDFTILQSVYYKDSPDFLTQSLQSIKDNTLQPRKIVLVKDGELTKQLDAVIAQWQKKLPLEVVGYKENKGLSFALNYGLQFIDTLLVARMDSDDICYKDRFEKQIEYLKEHTDIVLLGGFIQEFNVDPDEIQGIRKVPLEHKEIQRFLKKRNAFNHMTVIFRKDAVVSVGGYQEVPYFEDYDLWCRVVKAGGKTANIAQCLVKARIGNDMIARRCGLKYLKCEVYFLRRQLKRCYINRLEYIVLLVERLPLRLLPKCILRLFYSFLRSKTI